MSFWGKIKAGLIRFMEGRHGIDNLGMFTLLFGLILSLVATFTGLGLLSFLGLVLYIITIFRMFSRNKEARMKENRKYVDLTSNWKTKMTQFFRRCKNRKEYKYFKCPNCKALIRVKRGSGEKTISCVRCHHQFNAKA